MSEALLLKETEKIFKKLQHINIVFSYISMYNGATVEWYLNSIEIKLIIIISILCYILRSINSSKLINFTVYFILQERHLLSCIDLQTKHN